MQTAVETLPEDRVKLTVEVPADDVAHAVEHTIGHLAKDLRIPGFRKGKVPPRVVRARLGEEEIMEETLREHLPRWYGRAVDQALLDPIDAPEVDYEHPPVEGEPFSFTAVLTVPPVATLPKKLELKVVKMPADVPAEAIDAEIEKLRTGAGELAPVEDRPAADGDYALIDFVGRIDGKKMQDGSAEDYLVQIGSGRLVGDMEEQLIGMSPGDEKEVAVSFPADYGPKGIAGKEALFEVSLKELKARIEPELDDDFAKQVSEFETLAALRADITRVLSERAAAQVDGEFRAAALVQLGHAAEVDVPETMVLNRVQDRLEAIDHRMRHQGANLQQFLQATGQSPESLVAQLKPEALEEVRSELALKAFADREKITVSDDELRAFLVEEAAGEQDPGATVEKILSGPAGERVREDLRMRDALERLIEVVTPVPPSADAATTSEDAGAG